LQFDYQCAACGQFTRPLRRGRCARCQITAELATRVSGGIPGAFADLLHDRLRDDPERGIRWLRNSAEARILLPLLAEPEITHESLDFLAGPGRKKAVARLRWTLVTGGILPGKDPSLDHYHQRVAELLGHVPAGSLMAVRRYARWAVTRPLHERVLAGEVATADLTQWPLARIRTAAQFSASLDRAGRSLATATQSHLDAWTAELPSTAPLLRGFVIWAVSHGYMAAGLEVPWHASRERRGLDDEDRIALAARLLRDQDKEPRDRLGAVLVLLFGQSAARLARLRASAVSRDDDGRVYLALGETPVRLREPLAHLAVTVAGSALRSGSPWLFPGESGPMSSDQFRHRLTRVGVSSVLPARNSARASLAADVPPALLADKLGLSIDAAVAWSKAVGAARADYAGLRNDLAANEQEQLPQ
jgi:hypothetical protein